MCFFSRMLFLQQASRQISDSFGWDLFWVNIHVPFSSCLYYDIALFVYFFFHVVFSRGFILRFWHSLHISSHSQVFSLTSFILLSFGPFKNIGIIVVWDVNLRYCAWLFYLCTRWILKYLCLLDCSIFGFICSSNWQPSLYCILFYLTRSNIFLWIKKKHWYFCLIFSGVCRFVASSIVSNKGLFGKLTSVEVVSSKFQRS
jgi:hypothetical protein